MPEISSKSLELWIGVLAVLLVAGITGTIVADANAAGRPALFCIQEVTPMTEARAAQGLDSIVGPHECFETEAESFAATASVGGAGAGGARYGFFVEYTIFKIWENTGYGGASERFYSTTGCAGYYFVNDFNTIGWNDEAESAASYCGRDVDLWQHTYQGGGYWRVYNADSTLLLMNNESSSWDTAY